MTGTIARRLRIPVASLSLLLVMNLGGCPSIFDTSGNDNSSSETGDNVPGDDSSQDNPALSNNADKSNAEARYVGANACRNCHSDIAELHSRHGHAHKITAISGEPPTFPDGTTAGVPNPPDGFAWTDVAWVIGGYTKKARFVDQEGYILTTGSTGKKVQWNLAFGPNGGAAGFGNYEPDHPERKPFDYSCFVCHTTGALPQDEDFPEFQDNRPGMRGTFEEAGIQCEACHGPGSNHFTTSDGQVVIRTDRIFIDPDGSASCRACHNRPYDDQTGNIVASGGYLQHHEQWPELRASGGHAQLSCLDCHDPHRSVYYDKANAIRQRCADCHPTANMAGHAGAVYTRSDGYSEALGCESCHMSYPVKSATAVASALVGPVARIGDVRSHIVRINTEPVDYKTFFAADGKSVARDAQGRAAVTVDFVCVRCHNGNGLFELSVARAAEIAKNVHLLP
ncbi:MAG: Dissimilatory sulfite reductase [Phycisphaerae bacterium]|nr:Dissimilatory sulfite reductase [Phycisphaerae bacterium]